jgi:hypothetical protein
LPIANLGIHRGIVDCGIEAFPLAHCVDAAINQSRLPHCTIAESHNELPDWQLAIGNEQPAALAAGNVLARPQDAEGE